MLRDVVTLLSCATAIYAWLCAIVAPLARAVRAAISRSAGPRPWMALGLAVGAGGLWTIVGAGAVLLFMMLEPGAGLALLASTVALPGLALGAIGWGTQWALTDRIPRLGQDFEVASALAIVALVRDDPETLGRVEHLYRAVAVDPDGAAVGSGLRRAAV
jgi:hypothetical protein